MADTNTTVLGLLLMETGGDTNTWGQNLNAQVIQYLEDKLCARTSIVTTGGATTLTQADCRAAFIVVTGALGSDATLTVPNTKNSWIVINSTSGSFALKFKTSGGSASAAITQGGHCLVFCDGSDAITIGLSSAILSAQIGASDGTVSLPGYSFSSDTDSGLYRIGANHLGLALNGAKVVDYSTTGVSITGTLTSSGAFTVSAGGATITGNSNVTGTFGVSSDFAVATNKFTVAATSGNTAVAGTLAVTGAVSGPSFQAGSNPVALPGKAPTYQTLTSGTSATYTKSAGVTFIEVFGLAGGGGGGGTGAGGAGGDTVWDVGGANVTAKAGSGGALRTAAGPTPGAGGAGGAAGSGGTATTTVHNAGAAGNGGTAGTNGVSGTSNPQSGYGQPGGASIRGGAGARAAAANTNSGSGGGGVDGSNSGISAGAGSGAGGSGGDFNHVIAAPSATYLYTIGAAGAAGSGGGFAGGSGIIIVKEHYN